MLNELRVAGRHPHSGSGRPRRRPERVYELVAAKTADGWSYTDISLFLTSKWPEQCAGLSEDAVAAIHRRARTISPGPAPTKRLAVTTVHKMYAMLRTAWRYGIKHGLIPRERSYVMDEVTPPAARGEPEGEKEVWTPHQYSRFIDWAVNKRPDSWAAFY